MTALRFRLRRAAAALAAVAFLTASPAAAAKKKRKAPEPTAVPRPPDPTRVTITTPDGVALAASWRPVAGNDQAPAVLLDSRFLAREARARAARRRSSAEAGYATLAIDLRAHGESTKKNGQPIPISPRLLKDPNGFPRDVEAAAAWMKERAPKTAALGFSVGGYLALLAAARGQVDAAIVISVNEPRVAGLAGAAPPVPRSLLLLACEADPGRADSAKKLEAAAHAPKRLLLFPGAAHNLAVLREHPEAEKAVLDWLAERLK